MDSRNIASSQQQSHQSAWTWKRQSWQGLSMPINLYYRKKVFDDIRSILTVVGGEKTLQKFMDGCFGHLMHFIGGTSCGKALHELLSREITLPGAREDELWFRIGGTNIRFAPPEYALVTGLCFGSSTFDPLESHESPPDGVHKRLCNGHPITVGELWRRFETQLVRGYTTDDYLKVANILALYLMVMGYDQPRTVDQWVWVLVEDLDMWNRFPWGVYSYRTLMHYVSIQPRTRKDLGQKYHFYGPVWALQIWAYEAIPDLGRTCAVVTGKFTMPRCLKWSFRSRCINNNSNFTQFFKEGIGCSVTLEPTAEERSQLYWLSLQAPAAAAAAAAGGAAEVPHSCDDTSSVSVSLQQPRRSTRKGGSKRTPPVEAPSADGSMQSAPTRAARPRGRPKRTRVLTRSSSSSGEERVGVFDEDQFAQLTERLIESVAERLVPQMKEWIDQNVPAHKENMNTSMNPSGGRRETGRSSSDEEGEDDEDRLNNELELNDYKEASYKYFQYKTCRVRGSNGELRCPFCDDYEEEHSYFRLLLHAVRVAEVSRIGKKKANHLAMAKYLAIDLAGEVIKAD